MTNINPNKKNVHGTSKVTAVPAKAGGLPAWLRWLLAAIGFLLLLLLFRNCSHHEAPVTTTNTTTTTTTSQAAPAGTPPVAVEKVALPGGKTVDLEPKTLNYELQRFLASPDPAPRTFTFDRLNFSTDSADLPADAQATTNALAQILVAYPKANVQLNGYADSTGTEPHNVQLGAQRATAVAQALVGQGVAAGRIKTATGGSTNPTDTNASSQGRAENRRTELVVLAK